MVPMAAVVLSIDWAVRISSWDILLSVSEGYELPPHNLDVLFSNVRHLSLRSDTMVLAFQLLLKRCNVPYNRVMTCP